MSETTGVLAGTVATAVLNSAMGYMTPERRARLIGAARSVARKRPAILIAGSLALGFVLVRVARAAAAEMRAAKAAASEPSPGAAYTNGSLKAVRHAQS